MSFAEGFSAGYGAVSRGQERKRKAEQDKIANTRQERQDKLTALSQGYEVDPETGDFKPTAAKQTSEDMQTEALRAQMEAMQSEVQTMKSQASADGITNTIDSVIGGDWGTAKQHFGKIKETLKGAKGLDVADIGPVNFNDPTDLEQLENMGVDFNAIPADANKEEVYGALNRSLIKVQGHDGKTRIVPVDDIISQTNTWNHMNTQQRDRKVKAGRNITAILKGAGLTGKEQELQESTTDLAQSTTDVKQIFTEAQQQQMAELAKDPNATAADYQAILKPADPLKPGEIATQDKLYQEVKNRRISEGSNTDIEGLIATEGDFTQDQVNRAKVIQGKATLPNKKSEMMDASHNTVRGLAPIVKLIDSTDVEWGGVEKGLQSAIKLGGGTVEKLLDMKPAEREKIYNRMNVDSRVKTVVAGYIKMMSGAAVTTDERAFYNEAIMGGNWSTKEGALTSMKGFMEQQLVGYDVNLDSIAYAYPFDYTVQKRLRNKAHNEFMEVFPEESATKPVSQVTEEPAPVVKLTTDDREKMKAAIRAAQQGQ